MIYCKICLSPSTYPKSKFQKGLCSSCTYFFSNTNVYNEQKYSEILHSYFKKYPRKKGGHYDCVLGVSGGSDSTKLAIWLKEKFKMKALLVCSTLPPEHITETGAKNLSNLINLGFDIVITAQAPETWKKLIRKGFYDGNYIRGPELSLYSSLPQIAIKYGIELICWGEGGNAKDYNSKIHLSKNIFDANNLRYANTLKNCNTEWIKNVCNDESKLIQYTYPSVKEFKKNNLQIIYLGSFWKRMNFTYVPSYSSLHGLELRKDSPKNTGDLLGIKALDDDFHLINQMMKYLKYGSGRATDYMNYELREGEISRQDAIKIVNKYDGICGHKYIKKFCKFINISEKNFWSVVVQYTNKKLFKIKKVKSKYKITKKFIVGKGLNVQ